MSVVGVAVASLNLIRYTSGSQCICRSSGSDGEKRRAFSTTRAKQFYTRWNLDVFLAMLFKRALP